jgi:hypothetical protein
VLRRVAPSLLRSRRCRRVDVQSLGWIAPGAALRHEIYERYERMLDRRASALDSPIIAVELEEFFESGRRLGVRLLHPLWDPDLTSFLARVPGDVMIRGGRSKALVRNSLARRFPGLGFERQRKLTATNFYRSIVVDEGRRAWQALGGASALAALEVVDEGRLNRYMTQLFVGDDPMNQYRIWHLLSAEVWARRRL